MIATLKVGEPQDTFVSNHCEALLNHQKVRS